MVSFICNACGQTVRKNQVEKHYSTVCPQCEVLSCIDCGKDFHGDEYAGHTSCISEAEKYQGKLFQPKDKANKGEQKQQEWIKQLQDISSSDTLDPSIRKHLKTLKQYSNIPRKKAKFQNFCKNSVNINDQSTLDKLWEAFSGAKENGTAKQTMKENNTESLEVKSEKQTEYEINNSNTHDDSHLKSKKEKRKKTKQKEVKAIEANSSKDEENINENESRKVSKKKRKQEPDENHNEEESVKVAKVEENGFSEHTEVKFNWSAIIKQVLKKSPENELPVKKLRKKVIAEFLSRCHTKSYTDNELRALFLKKLSKNPKFKVKKEIAKLCK